MLTTSPSADRDVRAVAAGDLVEEEAERSRRARREDAGPRFEPDPGHPADDVTVTASVTTHPLPGRPPATVGVQLRASPTGPLRDHDHLDRVHGGVFAVGLHAVTPGPWPEGQHPLPCHVHGPSTRLVGPRATLVADLPAAPLPATGRPPLHDDWGLWLPWDGWSVWVERAGVGAFALTTLVSWTHGPSPASRGTRPEPDAVVRVALTLRRR